jgi:hypothetical protein
MAYRSKVQSTLVLAGPSIRQFERLDRHWRLGVLVDPDDAEPGTSWSGTPRADFANSMMRLDTAIRSTAQRSHYLGLAFESFDGLRQELEA